MVESRCREHLDGGFCPASRDRALALFEGLPYCFQGYRLRSARRREHGRAAPRPFLVDALETPQAEDRPAEAVQRGADLALARRDQGAGAGQEPLNSLAKNLLCQAIIKRKEGLQMPGLPGPT